MDLQARRSSSWWAISAPMMGTRSGAQRKQVSVTPMAPSIISTSPIRLQESTITISSSHRSPAPETCKQSTSRSPAADERIASSSSSPHRDCNATAVTTTSGAVEFVLHEMSCLRAQEVVRCKIPRKFLAFPSPHLKYY